MKLYNENLIARVRRVLLAQPDVEEKLMFSILAFMVNGKLCLGVNENELMVRIDPQQVADVIEKNGCRQMMHGKIPMKGYLLIEEEVIQGNNEFNFWINLP